MSHLTRQINIPPHLHKPLSRHRRHDKLLNLNMATARSMVSNTLRNYPVKDNRSRPICHQNLNITHLNASFLVSPRHLCLCWNVLFRAFIRVKGGDKASQTRFQPPLDLLDVLCRSYIEGDRHTLINAVIYPLRWPETSTIKHVLGGLKPNII